MLKKKVCQPLDESCWPEVLEDVVLEVPLSEDDIKEGVGAVTVEV